MKYKSIKKLYYSISEISEKLGIKPSVIRYWETEFKDLTPQKNRAGNRIYKEDDIDTIRLIHHYVHEKHLSIHDANDLIQDLKKEQLYKRKVKELSLIPPKLEHDVLDDEDDEIIEPSTEEDFEIDQDNDDHTFVEGFKIITRKTEVSKPEPFVEVVFDEEIESEDEEIEPEIEEKEDFNNDFDFEIVSPTKETFIYPIEEQPEDNEEIPQTPIFLKPKPKLVSPINIPQKNDPELKALLKKISSNINDIIDILNE